MSVRQLVWGHVDAGAGRGIDRGHRVLRRHVTQRTIKLDKTRKRNVKSIFESLLERFKWWIIWLIFGKKPGIITSIKAILATFYGF